MVIPEAEAIPFEPLDLRGERLLVLAPHPDDEVIGCGGLVALHLRDERKVRVVVATDGGEAGEPGERQRESRAAVASLGFAEVVLDPEGYRYRTGSGSDPITDSTWEKSLATARDTDTGF